MSELCHFPDCSRLTSRAAFHGCQEGSGQGVCTISADSWDTDKLPIKPVTWVHPAPLSSLHRCQWLNWEKGGLCSCQGTLTWPAGLALLIARTDPRSAVAAWAVCGYDSYKRETRPKSLPCHLLWQPQPSAPHPQTSTPQQLMPPGSGVLKGLHIESWPCLCTSLCSGEPGSLWSSTLVLKAADTGHIGTWGAASFHHGTECSAPAGGGANSTYWVNHRYLLSRDSNQSRV